MIDTKDILENVTQHDKLTIRVSSNNSVQLPKEVYQKLLKPHRKQHYFFVFLIKGQSTHSVDLLETTIAAGQILFILPHQIHLLPAKKNDIEYFKLAFDNTCLSLLPKPLLFLINPLNKQQVITLDKDAIQRVKMIFEMLAQLLQTENNNTQLILANLNTLLTECNHSYFINTKEDISTNSNISKFIEFKHIVETELTEQNSIQSIAVKLAVTSNYLYNIVKKYSGLSPKEFITNRLILEAQRKLYYAETSVKELAFELGFSDPAYFSKLFKKKTGKSITEFVENIQDLSGHKSDLTNAIENPMTTFVAHK
ncbi:helix-turn-helix domain-containing protein [Tamlana sp. 2_MG-2023]|uniref:AraC family transcriptional regulator n=1 Tax=unclassified Tamlana TaxID=2614803 RepID=UPI0026E4780F|nr:MULTISPECIES: helix-turn-helix domain-containing protein [unclassified Tamlana]MDO6761719.1 helix-turn-helix domain-containing protein [Tamlana sp. 2_MG-2023]MDO6792273.1 helix-turn-helix domain-containing protein [Tamlana sp. 1_MG-2023]